MLLNYNPSIICIDVANGNIDSLRKYAHEIKSTIELYHYKTLLMTGNVATYDSAKKLVDAGVDMVRVGIGNGALCTTRNVTGVGVPQLTAIDNCGNIDAYIVCDGGIRNSGDAVKALAMGADLIMMGTPFARTYESANNGIIYGQASRKLQEEYYHSVKSVEGLEKEVIKDISLADLISEYTWGMKSAFTYLNAKNIKELQKNAAWVETGTGSIKKL
jgi:IMP dehydrogenase